MKAKQSGSIRWEQELGCIPVKGDPGVFSAQQVELSSMLELMETTEIMLWAFRWKTSQTVAAGSIKKTEGSSTFSREPSFSSLTSESLLTLCLRKEFMLTPKFWGEKLRTSMYGEEEGGRGLLPSQRIFHYVVRVRVVAAEKFQAKKRMIAKQSGSIGWE